MGILYYGQSDHEIEIDDRTLAHLKVAILTQLRSAHGVAFTYNRGMNEGSGRETIWIPPTAEIRFQFSGSRPPRLNHQWIEEMLRAASGLSGLTVTEEPLEATQLVN